VISAGGDDSDSESDEDAMLGARLPACFIQVTALPLLERAFLKFERAAASSLFSRTTDLTSALQLLTWTMRRPNRKEGPSRLSSLVIEMHRVPSRCIDRHEIAENELWENLDRILGDQSYFSSLKRVELRLFLSDDDEELDEEDLDLAADLLLTSLSEEVRSVVISVEGPFFPALVRDTTSFTYLDLD
jgi:hypothetical protein